jgi:hypothetical protein
MRRLFWFKTPTFRRRAQGAFSLWRGDPEFEANFVVLFAEFHLVEDLPLARRELLDSDVALSEQRATPRASGGAALDCSGRTRRRVWF